MLEPALKIHLCKPLEAGLPIGGEGRALGKALPHHQSLLVAQPQLTVLERKPGEGGEERGRGERREGGEEGEGGGTGRREDKNRKRPETDLIAPISIDNINIHANVYCISLN